MCAATDKKLSGEVGFKGIAKKVLIFLLVGIANIRKGPGTDYGRTGKYTGIGTFTIVEEADGKSADALLTKTNRKSYTWY